MKKIISTCLLCAMLLALPACGKAAEAPQTTTAATSATTAGIVDTTTTTTATAATTEGAAPIVTTPAIEPEVIFVGRDGTEVIPHRELAWTRDIVTYSDGRTSQLDGDGYLMFYSIPNLLPSIADKIPTVTSVSTDSPIRVKVREGVTYEIPGTVEAYDENFQLVTADLAAHTFTNTPTLKYLFFTITFSDETAEYEKTVEYGYFVKILPGEPVPTGG